MPTQKTLHPIAPTSILNMVSGKSTIDHRIRTKLALTMEEYVFLQFLTTWFDDKKSNKPITEAILFANTGIKGTADIKRIISECKIKKMIEKKEIKSESGTLSVMYPTKVWFMQFETQDKFEEFWLLKDKNKVSIHKGNKASAQAMYKKALKVIDAKTIKQKFLAYVDWCNKSGTFQKHTSSWLNPTFKYWDDELPAVEKKEKTNNKEQIIHEVNDEDW